MPEWAREYFGRGYAQRWGLGAPTDDVRLEASGLYDLLHLSPRSRVVDIGCGHGRHAIAFAARGLDVIGLDFAPSLLARARQLALECGAHPRWVCCDMRRVPLRSRCADAAVIIDAFGFFETQDDEHAVLREAARVLKAGKRLLVKVVNGRPLVDAFRETDREEREGTVCAISRTLALDPPRMTERITISGRRGSGEYVRRQRLYRADDVTALLEHTGFSVLGVFGGPDGAEFKASVTPAMWVVATKG